MGTDRVDVLIVGGGIVGASLAIALSRSAPELAVCLVDHSEPSDQDDGRASAIAAAPRRMLEVLGVWPALADDAQPIEEVIVTDSRQSDILRPVFLTFEAALDDGEPFAQMVPNRVLAGATAPVLVKDGVVRRLDWVDDFVVGDRVTAAKLGSGGTIEARLLVAADGPNSRLRERAGIRALSWDYPQTGLVATVGHERPHHGTAEEHFLPSGPFAFLPLRGDRSSIVWTERPSEARRLTAADPATVNQEIARRVGHRLGAITIETDLRSYPLGIRLARDFVKPRFCLIGDAAHTIHPIAGQGLNLGLRDVAALTETVVEALRLGLDIGSVDVLERYQRWRRFDTAEMALLTDGLNRLFSNDNPILRPLRDIGLGLVDRLPWLKRMMIEQAAGLDLNAPRLLRGEAI